MSKSKASAIIIKSSGKVEEVTFKGKKPKLEELQGCVGGYIECVYLKDGKVLVVNEDGKMLGLPQNEKATSIIVEQGRYDFIVGDALLIDYSYL